MRVHSDNFKQKLKEYKIVKYIVSYDDVQLTENDLDYFNPVVNTDLLKSLMKEFYFTTKKFIPNNTIINVKYGILIEDEYEYMNFGDYIIKESEYDPNTKKYSYKCYDFMLKTMIDYEKLDISYPISISNYIKAICDYCGLDFTSTSSFANSAKEIKEDYFDNGNYTFRDILDFLSQLVGGWICINENNNEVEIRYPNETNEVIDGDYIRNINVNFTKKYGPVNSVVFSRGDGSDNIYRRDDDSVSLNGLCEIKISDNPFLEDSDRDKFIDEVFNKLKGLEFYILDIDTVGILYLEVGDIYNFDVGNENTSLKSGILKSGLRKSQSDINDLYKCLYLNGDIQTNSGLTETIFVDEPETSETDYKTSALTDNSLKNAIIQTNKNSAEILLKVNSDEIISSINLSPEAITIDSSKISLAGKEINLTSDDIIISSTNFNVDKDGNMTCNNGNFSGIVTASSGSIGGWNINDYKIFNENATSGNACCMQIPNYEYTSGSYTNYVFAAGATSHNNYSDAKFSVNKNGYLKSTSGSIGGWNIASDRLYTSNNGLYANGEIYMYPTAGGILALNDGFRLKAPNGIGIYNSYTAYNGTTNINSGITIMSASGNLNLMSYSSSNSVNIRSYCSSDSVTNAGAGGIMIAAANNISLNSVAGVCYAKGNGLSNGLIKTDSGSASSRSVKENIVEFNTNEYDEALDLLDKIKIYNYDYKYNLYRDKHQYGFIIDDIEEIDDKFFKFTNDKAIVKDEEIDFNLDNATETSEIINVKKYDSDVLDKYLLTCIKGLQNKIKELENKI